MEICAPGVRPNSAEYEEVLMRNSSIASTEARLCMVRTMQSLASVDAMEEFRISTSSYSAEFGRTPGAQISIQTRSGTNRWHGSAFNYFRNNVLDANNWFNDAAGINKTPERQNDFGGTLGGPVVIPRLYDGRDKTFFFFSYE